MIVIGDYLCECSDHCNCTGDQVLGHEWWCGYEPIAYADGRSFLDAANRAPLVAALQAVEDELDPPGGAT
jgi:hypothetical protein